MSPVKHSFVLILFISTLFLMSSTRVAAHNITLILERYPDFSQFNSLLSQTKLADVINHRRTITILAVTNGRLGDLYSKPQEVVKRILSTHIVLDYYDRLKLNKLKATKNMLTTLYQSSGVADDQQGFLDVIHKTDGTIVFGSAMKGAQIDAQLEGSVASMPYNISVLSISHPIIAPGIDGSYITNVAPPPVSLAPLPAKVPPPAESPEEEVADAPLTDASQPSEAPLEAPADAPIEADAPIADGPEVDADMSSGVEKHVASSILLGFIAAIVHLAL